MKTSCIQTPSNSRFIQLNEPYLRFCQGNHCAAVLLSFFASWHDWKIRNDDYYRRANDIAEMHGDGRPNNQNAYMFFTTEDLVDGLLGLFGKTTIAESLKFLVSLTVIKIENNPNPRYKFDKTKYFKFYPDVVNHWLANESFKTEAEAQVVDLYDRPKIANRVIENSQRVNGNSQPSTENSQAITDTTNNTTNKNKLINSLDEFLTDEAKELKFNSTSDLTQAIIDVLIEKGVPAEKFNTESTQAIQRLHLAGATFMHFIEGYNISCNTTKSNRFAINYLIRVVESLLEKAKKENSMSYVQKTKVANGSFQEIPNEIIYESKLDNAKSWAADLFDV